MEEAIGKLHDIVLRHARHMLAVMDASIFEGIADDHLATWTRDKLEWLNHLIRLPMLDAGIELLFVLADDDELHLRVFRCYKGCVGNTGANIGEQAERFTHGH